MKAVGVVAEFDPFHSGHRYLLEEALDRTGADCAVAVMSGPFTQRGMPAARDKWERARDAVEAGFDLVVELPPAWACASAQIFAGGGLRILRGMGGVRWIAFGSETGDGRRLMATADFISENRERLTGRIRALTREGRTYPQARAQAVRELSPDFDERLLEGPNDILAVEYLERRGDLIPVAVKRAGAGHHESASQLRAAMRASSPSAWAAAEDRYFTLIRSRVLAMEEKDLDNLASAAAGLGRKLRKEVLRAGSLTDLVGSVKSRAFTETRVRRLLADAVLGLTREETAAPPCVHILALSRKGGAFLKENQRLGRGELPVISNWSKERRDHPDLVRAMDRTVFAQALWGIIWGRDLYQGSDLVRAPYLRK